jgi:hypothetical protein
MKLECDGPRVTNWDLSLSSFSANESNEIKIDSQ